MARTLVLLAHNIRSLWNVGSLFRTCDAFGVEKLYLTGYTATPPRREISKTGIGAEEFVAWAHHTDPRTVIESLRAEGFTIIALEQTADAADLTHFASPEKCCLVIGNEVAGVPRELIDMCDGSVEIRMHGKKESLNVAVAAGIALHHLRNH